MLVASRRQDTGGCLHRRAVSLTAPKAGRLLLLPEVRSCISRQLANPHNTTHLRGSTSSSNPKSIDSSGVYIHICVIKTGVPLVNRLGSFSTEFRKRS